MQTKTDWRMGLILGFVAVLVLSPAARAEETAGGGNSEAHTRRHHDKTERTEARKEHRKEEFKERVDKDGNGEISKAERQNAKEHLKKRFDRDDNPPGPRGGRGTNWENPPGPKGGPGASPNRKHRKA